MSTCVSHEGDYGCSRNSQRSFCLPLLVVHLKIFMTLKGRSHSSR